MVYRRRSSAVSQPPVLLRLSHSAGSLGNNRGRVGVSVTCEDWALLPDRCVVPILPLLRFEDVMLITRSADTGW